MGFPELTLLIALGLVGPLLASVGRWAPPIVVGEILAGVVVGRSGFGWVDPTTPVAVFLSDVGFALLMLIVGTHLPLRRGDLRPAIRRAVSLTGLTAVLAAVVGVLLDRAVGFGRPALLAVLIATSSAAVIAPILNALAVQGAAVVVVTAWVTALDVLTVLAVPVVLRTGSMVRLLVGMGAVMVAAFAIFGVRQWLGRRSAFRSLRRRSKREGWALDLRFSLLVLFGLVAIGAAFGLSPLVAGFAAGVVLALTGQPRRLGWQLIGLGEGFFVPVFFVLLGARLDVSGMFGSAANLTLAAGLALLAVAVHVTVAIAGRMPVAYGLVASAQMGVPAAVASLGLSSGLLVGGQAAAILGSVLVTLLVCAAGAATLGHRNPIVGTVGPGVDPSDPTG
jgi:Kef-type K+ transport system membrane component KefB